MKRDFRALAQRHLWLSWWWGLFLVACLFLLSLDNWFYSLLDESEKSFSWGSMGVGHLLSLIPLLATVAFILGLSALLIGLTQRAVVRRIFATAASLINLIARVALVSISSVALLWLPWFLFYTSSAGFIAFLFFALSSPWLISSIAAAWWLGRRLFPR